MNVKIVNLVRKAKKPCAILQTGVDFMTRVTSQTSRFTFSARSYECDEYVLNDNAAGDLKILRSALGAVATQTFSGVEARGRRLLRSQSFSGFSTRCVKPEGRV